MGKNSYRHRHASEDAKHGNAGKVNGMLGKENPNAGRRSKLNDDFIRRAYQIIREGNYTNVACQILGVSTESWFRWMRDGQAVLEGASAEEIAATKKMDHKPSEEYLRLTSEFYASIKKAEAEAEADMVKRIRQASREHWQAAAWYLERKFRDRWGRNLAVEETKVDVSSYHKALNAVAEDVWDEEEQDAAEPVAES